MRRKCVFLSLIVLALLPSAWVAWTWREMPHLGIYHDDSLYWVAAKSLAAGEGYRIESLPEQPYQTKYPPLYPLLLSLVWKIAPQFPANLSLAMLVSWLLLPVYVAAAWLFYRRSGIGPNEALWLCALLALNPLVATLSVMLMSELLFGSILLATMVVAERASRRQQPAWLALAAGLLGALAFLTRSAALPLLVSAPLCFLLRKHYRGGVLFLAGMLPAVVGWLVWSAAHTSSASDWVTLYYTSYLKFHLENVPLAEMPSLVWKNAGALIYGLSDLLIFGNTVNFWTAQLSRLVAAAGVAGSIRLAWRKEMLFYPAFSVLFLIQALLWHYPPHDRFVVPVLPLLLAGFWTEMKHLAGVVRVAFARPKLAERVVAGFVTAVLCTLAVFAVYRTWHGLASFLPGVLEHHRRTLAANRQAFAWLAANSTVQSRVFAYGDPLVYLYTGRRACSLRIPPRLLYKGDRRGIEGFVERLPQFVRDFRLDYVLFTMGDFQLDSPEIGFAALRRVLREHPGFELSYQGREAAVYRIVRN